MISLFIFYWQRIFFSLFLCVYLFSQTKTPNLPLIAIASHHHYQKTQATTHYQKTQAIAKPKPIAIATSHHNPNPHPHPHPLPQPPPPTTSNPNHQNHKQVTNPKSNHKKITNPKSNHNQIPNSNPQLLNHQEQILQIQTHKERKNFTNLDPRNKNFTNSDPRRIESIGRRQAVKPSGGIGIWHLCQVLIRSLGVLGGSELWEDWEREGHGLRGIGVGEGKRVGGMGWGIG